MSLRVVSGKLGGRRFEAPRGRGTRPTLESVREAWFSALADRIPGCRILDLFAGSGALGIEALSRGAVRACFVEADRRACAVLKRNLARLDLEDRAEVHRADALVFVQNLVQGPRPAWDVALADPPYEGPAAARLVEAFGVYPFAGILCVEHQPGASLPATPQWQRRYGDTALSFFLAPREGASAP